ncbi:MAG: hypothetical protein HY270_02640 [Deltaproteobacteria bacterium]|nr:hypothetical protein [Deltaproteobacteria bacterium]
MNLRSLAVIGLLSLVVGNSLAAETLNVGSPVAPFAIADQNDATHNIDAAVRIVVFTADMGAGGVVKEALGEGGREQLAQAQAVYVSDISRMPGVVAKLFAMPALRKRDYPILLDRDGSLTKNWPRSDGKVTLLEMDGSSIKAIHLLSSSTEVREALRTAVKP